MTTAIYRRISPWLLVATFGVAVPACVVDDSTPSEQPGPAVTVPDIAADPVEATFTVSIDPTHPALLETTLDPKPGVATVVGQSSELALTAWVKPVVKRPGILWVELYFENLADTALRDVVVNVGDGAAPLKSIILQTTRLPRQNLPAILKWVELRPAALVESPSGFPIKRPVNSS
ncbi:MAG: hypothetical protein IPK82_37120 [Polyangiaceae bacterium]|nr:hypothetical protein [Polyangiaceae bacterium]